MRSRNSRGAAIALITVLLLAIVFFAFRLLSRRRDAATAEQGLPVNVILITLDTLRTDRLSCYGSKSVQTPSIDALAAEGVLFTNAASAVPLTLPAHASIMTGLYPPGHGVNDNVGFVLDQRLPTLAELLQKRGWSTAGFVSAFVLDRRWGIARGFSHFHDRFGLEGFAAEASADMGSLQRDGAQTVAAAVSWLDSRPKDRPFFLWLHLYDPHEPYTPREPFKSRYPGRPYDAEVAYTDSLVGEFRNALQSRGLLDQSLVVLTSDHGEGLGDHGERSHGFFVYDSTVRAAMILRLPLREAAGRVVDATVSHVDLLPTILDLLRVPASADVDGRSLAPLISKPELAWNRPAYSESLYPLMHYGWAPLRTVRTNRYKLIDAPRPELYDLKRDAAETQNLHDSEAGRARELAVLLADLRHSQDKRKPAESKQAALDSESVAKLRSLGYLGSQSGAEVKDEHARRRVDPKDRIQLHEKIMLAQGLMVSHEPVAARPLLEQVLAEDDSICEAHQMLGEIALSEDRAADAVVHFRRALQLNPEHERSLFGLATGFAALQRYDDAILGYKRILQMDGSNARASLAIADIQVSRGRFEDAAAVLEQASAKGNASGFFINKLGEVRVAQDRDDEAIALFERAIPPEDDFALPHFNLGVIHEKRGDVPSAIAQYERAVKIEPRFCRAQFNLGRLHASTGNVELARQLWEASIESCPGFVQGRYHLAKLLMDSGELERAFALAQEGIELDPQHHEGPLGYYILADLLNRGGRQDDAREAMAKGREIQAAMK